MSDNTLYFVTRRGPLDQTVCSMVSQLLELGVCFVCDPWQALPDALPVDLERYPALLVDEPMLGGLDIERLDRYARGGGQVWCLEELMSSVKAQEGRRLGLNSRMLIDLTTFNRAQVILLHSRLRPDRARLRRQQAQLSPQSQMRRLVDGQRIAFLLAGFEPPFGEGLQKRVATEGVMVVEILVGRRNSVDPLGQERPLIVYDEQGIARIVEDIVDRVEQADPAVHLAQERQAAVAGEVAALEIRDDLPTIHTGEEQGLRGIVCHADGLSVCDKKRCNSLYSKQLGHRQVFSAQNV